MTEPKHGGNHPGGRSRRVVPDERTIAICARIKQAREQKGLSQHKLALHLGITAGAVGQWDLGRNLPQMKTFEELAAHLGVSRDWLLTGQGPEERGIAQDITEKKALSLIRDMSTEGRMAATTFMENCRDLKTGDPLDLVHLIEVWAGLSQSNRVAANAMVEGLARATSHAPVQTDRKDTDPKRGIRKRQKPSVNQAGAPRSRPSPKKAYASTA